MNYEHIKTDTHCKPASAYEMKGIIDHLKRLGVPINEWCDGEEFDEWPCIAWGPPGKLDQQKGLSGELVSVDEFVALFEPQKLPKIGEYQFKIEDGKLIVGCHTIPFETVKTIYKAMKKAQ